MAFKRVAIISNIRSQIDSVYRESRLQDKPLSAFHLGVASINNNSSVTERFCVDWIYILSRGKASSKNLKMVILKIVKHQNKFSYRLET